jgi:WD40 repeat protein
VTRGIDLRTLDGDVEPSSLALDGEPANATFSGDLLIVSLRRPAGREVEALDMMTGQVAWTAADPATFIVRCADDRHPPCFAVMSAPRDHVVAFDSATGWIGATVYERAADDTSSIEDIAVSSDGTRLLVAGRGRALIEITATGALVRELAAESGSVRSVAYDPQGGVLIAGTSARNRYQVGVLRDKLYRLGTSDNEMLSIVRPSPDGAQVLATARRYEPTLYRLDLAGR